MCLINRKPGMSVEDFRTYYETNHVPLVTRLLPFFTAYERNYRDRAYSFVPAHLATRFIGPEFDVVTEVSFAGPPDYQRMLDALANPEIGDVIRADEENFLDRRTMALYMVETLNTPGVVTPSQGEAGTTQDQ
nr:EthD domain-containing protein [Sphingobium sp. Sx8-8]